MIKQVAVSAYINSMLRASNAIKRKGEGGGSNEFQTKNQAGYNCTEPMNVVSEGSTRVFARADGTGWQLGHNLLPICHAQVHR